MLCHWLSGNALFFRYISAIPPGWWGGYLIPLQYTLLSSLKHACVKSLHASNSTPHVYAIHVHYPLPLINFPFTACISFILSHKPYTACISYIPQQKPFTACISFILPHKPYTACISYILQQKPFTACISFILPHKPYTACISYIPH